MEAPSIAAIVVFGDPSGALARFGKALAARGMAPSKNALPAGYKPAPNEWVGALALPLPPFRRGRESHPNTAIVTTEVPRIFTLAMWLSAAEPEEVLVAWRCFSGFEPVTKVLWGGMPRWKHGADPDHEIQFSLPIGQPAEARPPREARVPLEHEAVSALLTPLVKPLKDPLRQGGAAWIHRSSMLF